MGKKTLTMGEVTKLSGLPASTIRYYEERRLIKTKGRRSSRRIFDPHVMDRLALILLGRYVGFSLDEIATLVMPNSLKLDNEQLSCKADQLDRKIEQLIAMRDRLRHAAVCSAPSHFECPKFQRVLRIVIKNQCRKKR